MWLMECFFFLFAITLITFFAGQPLLILLFRPNEWLTVERFCLALLLGTFTVSYLFAIGSYCDIQGKYIGVPIIISVLIVNVLMRNYLPSKVKKGAVASFLLIFFCAAFVSFLPIFLYNSFTPFNDTIAYISISDYLQTHGFLKKYIDSDGLHPLENMILIFQNARIRMGANFLLAAFQSMFKIKNSIDIFPVLQTWGMILNLASICIASRWIFHLKLKNILIILAFVAVTFNPISFAIHYGFNNQLYGTAYYLLALAAFSRLLLNSYSMNATRWVMVSAVSLSSVVIFYPEVFPFVFLAQAFSLFIPFIRHKENKIRWVFLLFLLTVVTILSANFSFYGMVISLLNEGKWVVGWNIDYNLQTFINSALGIMPSESYKLLVTIIGIFYLLLFVFGIYKMSKKGLSKHIVWLNMIAVYSIAFVYFLLFVDNPWFANTKGHTWSMFKIVNWAFPSLILGVGYGISLIPYKKAITLMILGCSIFAGAVSYPGYLKYSLLANMYTKSDRPFEAYHQFASAVTGIKTDQPFELVIDNSKNKDVLAYYLISKPIITDWNNDCYLGCLPLKFRNIKVKAPHYVIVDSHFVLTEGAKKLPANTMLIESTDPYITYFKDTYDVESSPGATWHWSSGNATIGIMSAQSETQKLKFDISTTTLPATLDVSVNENPSMKILVDKMGWNTFELFTDLKKGENTLKIKTKITPLKIGNDPRLLAFAIKDIRLYDLAVTYISFFKNFYNSESENGHNWRWSKSNAYIGLNSGKTQAVKLKFDIHSASIPATVRISLGGNKPLKIRITTQGWIPVNYMAALKSGDNLLSLETSNKPIRVNKDPRLLSFAVRDVEVLYKKNQHQ